MCLIPFSLMLAVPRPPAAAAPVLHVVHAEKSDENGDETCGYAALIQRHRRQFPPREALQVRCGKASGRGLCLCVSFSPEVPWP